MPATVVANVVAGFSPVNRALIYLNFLLSPTQLFTGFDTNCPSNLGFLAFNLYQQYIWFTATKAKQLHALSLVVPYINLMYTATYMAGVLAGNPLLVWLQGLIVMALITLNTVIGWVSLTTNMPEGDGIYRFWFFGWRVLSKGWRGFFTFGEVMNTISAIGALGRVISLMLAGSGDEGGEVEGAERFVGILKWTAVVLVSGWPFVMWMELIVNKNGIVSETDWVSVYLFIAQVVTMLIPAFFCC